MPLLPLLIAAYLVGMALSVRFIAGNRRTPEISLPEPERTTHITGVDGRGELITTGPSVRPATYATPPIPQWRNN